MTSLARVQEVIGDHRVAADAGGRHAVSSQDEQVVLDVLIDLLDTGVFEQGAETAQRLIGIELWITRRAAHRQIPGLARLPADRVADNLTAQRLQPRRFQVDGETLLLPQLVEELLETDRRVNQVIRRLPLRGRCRARRAVARFLLRWRVGPEG